MAVWTNQLWLIWTSVIVLWMWEIQAEEVEIFSSDQRREGWTSSPRREWNEINIKFGTKSAIPVLQACKNRKDRSFLSPWKEVNDVHHLLMDITFAQEEEPSGELHPLRAHLYDTNTPISKFQEGDYVELQASRPFPGTRLPDPMTPYLNINRTLNLGSVNRGGFQLAFSYSGSCVFVGSMRVYYRRCPRVVDHLVTFGTTGAGSGPRGGSCVKGAVEVSPPRRECTLEGEWGPLQGGCTCQPGHEVIGNTCQACRMGHYKPANDSAGCRLCPANTRTLREGSERCDCLQGFSRLETEPDDHACTKPPSAPVNLTAHHYNDSVLTLTWDPPLDQGGRQEVMYRVKCEREVEAGAPWEACGDGVMVLPSASGLNSTSVSIAGVNPQCGYRLSVQALNDISRLQGALQASTATVTIHRWREPPVLIPVTVATNISKEQTPAPQQQKRLPMWVTIGVFFSILLLIVVVPILCLLRRHYTKDRRLQHDFMELLPVDPEVSYRRPVAVVSAPQEDNVEEGVAQMLEGLSDRLLASLKEVLVERTQLTLGKELGKGEFGSVYEGIFTPEEGMDIKVAVKTMRVGLHREEDLHEFLTEADIMKNFDHENVVKLLGVTLQREQDSPLPVPLVILPYMKHGDLRRFLIATRYGDIPMFVPHQSLLRFMIDIAAGMSYLSSKGFLHRDLAARNCMLGDDLRVSVADFGLSKKIYSSNYYRQRVAIRVPVKWLAMESLSESVYTTKSDVWSFGVTMWEIVSRGRTPYPGVHNHELLDLLQSGFRNKPPEDCDEKLYGVMQSCWNKEPNRRPGFEELGEMLKGLLSELPALEASQEANYINQGLEVAAAAAAACPEPQTENCGGRGENFYLPNPVARVENVEDAEEEEDGYLKYIAGSAVKMDDDDDNDV